MSFLQKNWLISYSITTLTARLNFVDQLKEVIPDKISFDEIDSDRQLKKFENQKLSIKWH